MWALDSGLEFQAARALGLGFLAWQLRGLRPGLSFQDFLRVQVQELNNHKLPKT